MPAINKSRFAIFLALLLIGVGVLTFAVYIETKGKPFDIFRSMVSSRMTKADGNKSGSVDAMRPFGSDDNVLGSPRSPITLITYGDTECPFTKEFFGVMQKIMAEYGDGRVAWIFRHFPNDELHPSARAEAEAAECAGQVGGKMKFWDYLKMVFEQTKSHNTLDPDNLTRIAYNLGIPEKEFEACMASRVFANRVANDAENARQIGAQGTPTTVIMSAQGKPTRIDGFASYEEMKDTIDTMLFLAKGQ